MRTFLYIALSSSGWLFLIPGLIYLLHEKVKVASYLILAFLFIEVLTIVLMFSSDIHARLKTILLKPSMDKEGLIEDGKDMEKLNNSSSAYLNFETPRMVKITRSPPIFISPESSSGTYGSIGESSQYGTQGFRTPLLYNSDVGLGKFLGSGTSQYYSQDSRFLSQQLSNDKQIFDMSFQSVRSTIPRNAVGTMRENRTGRYGSYLMSNASGSKFDFHSCESIKSSTFNTPLTRSMMSSI